MSAAAPMPAGQSGTVKVAILLPLSGPNSAVGQSMLQAAQLAVFDMGYDNFELMPQDTLGTASGASSAAIAAVNGGAQLILGPLFAEEVRAVKAATASKNINVIAFSTDWTLAGGNTYIMGFLPFGQVERIVDYAASKGLKRAAVASGADEYGTTVSRTFESEAADRGITITRALSDPAGYDSVFIPAGGKDLAAILPRVTNTTAQKLGTGLWDDARVAAMPQMNGAWFAAPAPSTRASFESRYQSTYGAKPVRIASMAYDATALSMALSRNGAGGFTAAAMTSSNGFAGVDGIIRFDSRNLVERGMAVLAVQNGRIVEIDPAPKSFR
jgi:ABC-type branched-subunit amino acid transport system substrate-binding protein